MVPWPYVEVLCSERGRVDHSHVGYECDDLELDGTVIGRRGRERPGEKPWHLLPVDQAANPEVFRFSMR